MNEQIIKFRAVALKTGEWVYGHYYHKSEVSETGFINQHFIVQTNKYIQSEHIQINPVTIGQFTNRFDKNGKAIYDGDIVQATGNFECHCPNCTVKKHSDESIAIVKIKNGNTKISYNNVDWYDFDYNNRCIIIGNIYENPELVKLIKEHD
jgi:uncharacterized phage protein (TIGR01671 family)